MRRPWIARQPKESYVSSPAVQATATHSVRASGPVRGYAGTNGTAMAKQESVPNRVLSALEDAQLVATRHGHEDLVASLRLAAVEVADWQLMLAKLIYKLEQGEEPDPPTPWFERRERENAELRNVVELDAYRRRKEAA